MDRIYSMKWLILLVAVGSATLSLLNTFHALDWKWTWKVAILVGEFGHWLILFPLGVAG